MWPAWEARWSGVAPLLSTAFTLKPAFSSNFIQPIVNHLLIKHARKYEKCYLQNSFGLHDVRLSSLHCPLQRHLRPARRKHKNEKEFIVKFATFRNKYATTSAFPLAHATCKGATPSWSGSFTLTFISYGNSKFIRHKSYLAYTFASTSRTQSKFPPYAALCRRVDPVRSLISSLASKNQ